MPEQPSKAGTPATNDAFVARLSETLTGPAQATYAMSNNFPNTANGAIPTKPGGSSFDAFVARLTPALDTLVQATYYGGLGIDRARGLAIHPLNGDVYVGSETSSDNLPGRETGAQSTVGGSNDSYIARITADLAGSGGVAPTITTPSPLPPGAIGTPYSHTIMATGSTPITFTQFSGNLPPGLTLASPGHRRRIPMASISSRSGQRMRSATTPTRSRSRSAPRAYPARSPRPARCHPRLPVCRTRRASTLRGRRRSRSRSFPARCRPG